MVAGVAVYNLDAVLWLLAFPGFDMDRVALRSPLPLVTSPDLFVAYLDTKATKTA